MHVAVFDDNIADRKQMERLIKKESDKRASSDETLYMHSFGNVSALFSTLVEYDIFFIDMCKTENQNGSDIAYELIKQGVTVPIVMCCSEINYWEIMSKDSNGSEQELPKNLVFIDKPIRTEDLSKCIDHALSIKKASPNLIELRERENTVYVTEEDILYGIENGAYVTVTLTDGRKIQAVATAANLFQQIEIYPSFMLPSLKLIINGRYIDKLRLGKVYMTDGACFKMPRAFKPYAQKLLNIYKNQS